MSKKTGERIRQKRKEKHLTQEDLGKLVNRSAQVISNWERGYTTPDSEDLYALSKALNVSADFLLCRTDDPNQTLSEGVRLFLEAVDLEDEKAIEIIKNKFKYKGEKIPDSIAREILRYARFRLSEK